MSVSSTVQWFAQQLNAAVPGIPIPIFEAWITGEKGAQWNGAGGFPNNPLNVSYVSGNAALNTIGQQNGGMSSGQGATTLATFATPQAGVAATAWWLQNWYPNFIQAAQQSTAQGSVVPFQNALASSSWGTHDFAGAYTSLFGSTALSASTSGGSTLNQNPLQQLGTNISNVWNGATNAAGGTLDQVPGFQGVTTAASIPLLAPFQVIGNGVGLIQQALAGATNPGQYISAIMGGIPTILQGIGQAIGKWLILALLGIGIFILTLHLVTGGQSTVILQTATKAAAT